MHFTSVNKHWEYSYNTEVIDEHPKMGSGLSIRIKDTSFIEVRLAPCMSIVMINVMQV